MRISPPIRLVAIIVVFCFAATTIAWSAPSVIATPPITPMADPAKGGKAGEAISLRGGFALSSLAPPSRFSEDIREESPTQIERILRGLFVPGILLLSVAALNMLGYNVGRNEIMPQLMLSFILFPTSLLLLSPYADSGGGSSGGSRNFGKLSNERQRARVKEAAHDAAMNHDQDKATLLGTAGELGMSIDDLNRFLEKNPFNFRTQSFSGEGSAATATPQKPASPTPSTPAAAPGTPKKAEPWANLLAAPSKPPSPPRPAPDFAPRPAATPVIASPATGRAKQSPSAPKPAKPAAPAPAPKPADKPAKSKYRQAQWKDLTPPKQKARFSKAVKTMLQTGAQLTWPTIAAALGTEVIDVRRFAQKNNFNIETGKFEKTAAPARKPKALSEPKTAASATAAPAPLSEQEKNLEIAKDFIVGLLRDVTITTDSEKRKGVTFDSEVWLSSLSGVLELQVGKAKDNRNYRPRLSTGGRGKAKIRVYDDKDLEGLVVETERLIRGKAMTRTYLIEPDQALGFNRLRFIEKFREILRRRLERPDDHEHKKITFDALAAHSGNNASISVGVKDVKGKTHMVFLAAGKKAGPVSVTIAYDEDLGCDTFTVTNKRSGEVVTSIKKHDETMGVNAIDKYRMLLKCQLLDLDGCNEEGGYKGLRPFEIEVGTGGQWKICLLEKDEYSYDAHLSTGSNEPGPVTVLTEFDPKRKCFVAKTKRAINGKTVTTTSVIGFDPMRGVNDFFQIEKNGKPTGFGPPIVSIESLDLFPKESARILMGRFERIVTDAVASNSNVSIEAIQDMLLEARITASSQRIKEIVEKLRPQPAQDEISELTASRKKFQAEVENEVAQLTVLRDDLQKQLDSLKAENEAYLAQEPVVTVSSSIEQGISVAVAFEPPATTPAPAPVIASLAEGRAKQSPPDEIASSPQPAASAAKQAPRNDVSAISFDDFSKQLGARIRERRDKLKWSRKILSDAIKNQTKNVVVYSEPEIAAIEQGKNLTLSRVYDCFNALRAIDELDEFLGADNWRAQYRSTHQSRLIGNEIRRLRNENDYAWREPFAKKLGYSVGAVASAEAGKQISYYFLAAVEWVIDANFLKFIFDNKLHLKPAALPAPAPLGTVPAGDCPQRESALAPKSRFAGLIITSSRLWEILGFASSVGDEINSFRLSQFLDELKDPQSSNHFNPNAQLVALYIKSYESAADSVLKDNLRKILIALGCIAIENLEGQLRSERRAVEPTRSTTADIIPEAPIPKLPAPSTAGPSWQKLRDSDPQKKKLLTQAAARLRADGKPVNPLTLAKELETSEGDIVYFARVINRFDFEKLRFLDGHAPRQNIDPVKRLQREPPRPMSVVKTESRPRGRPAIRAKIAVPPLPNSFKKFAKQLGARIKSRKEELGDKTTVVPIEEGGSLTLSQAYACFDALGMREELPAYLGAEKWCYLKEPTPQSNAVGEKIREIREKVMRCSKEDLVSRMNIRYRASTIGLAENGTWISLRLLSQIEALSNVNLLEFLFELRRQSQKGSAFAGAGPLRTSP